MEPVANTTNQGANYLPVIYLAKLKYFDFDTFCKKIITIFHHFFFEIFLTFFQPCLQYLNGVHYSYILYFKLFFYFPNFLTNQMLIVYY